MGTIKIIKVIFNTLLVYQDNIGIPGLGFCTPFLETTGIGVFKYKCKTTLFWVWSGVDEVDCVPSHSATLCSFSVTCRESIKL